MGLLLVLAGQAGAEEPVVAGQVEAEDPAELTRMASVVTGGRLPDECLASVEITRIDGVDQAVPAQGFNIEAGFHSLNGRALLDTSKCRPLDTRQYIPPADDLVMEFEPDKSYYIAFDRSYQDPDHWRLVVWKEEQIPVESSGNTLETEMDLDLPQPLSQQDPIQ